MNKYNSDISIHRQIFYQLKAPKSGMFIGDWWIKRKNNRNYPRKTAKRWNGKEWEFILEKYYQKTKELNK